MLKQRGMALVLVLWMTAVIALLVITFSNLVRTSIKVSDVESKLIKHSALIDSGLEIAVSHLIDKNKETQWKADSTDRQIRVNEKVVTINIQDPNGLVDLNKSNSQIVYNLLSEVISTKSKVDQLFEAILRLRPEKKEKSDKKGKKPKTAFENVFIDLTQLHQLDGMTKEIYDKITPFLTVHGRDGKINPVTALYEVLVSVPGITRIQARDLVNRRANLDPKSQYFSDLKSRTGNFLNLNRGNVFIITVMSSWLDTGKQIGKKYIVVTELDNKSPYRLLSWEKI